MCKTGFETADALDRFRAVQRGQTYKILFPSDLGEAIEALEEKLNRRPAPEEITDGKLLAEWISVSERFPAKSEYRDKATRELVPLLVYVKGTEYPFRAFYDGKNWGDGWNKIYVTHWMPLPAAPKEEF